MERENMAIVGGGTMGSGLALLYASHGHRVRVYDISGEALEKARDRILNHLDLKAEMGRLGDGEKESVLENIAFTTDLQACCRDADFLVEAVPEDLELKKEVFPQLASLAPPDCILASNTSTLNVPGELEGDYLDRVLITHYFNPPQVIPLVEVVRGERTSQETVDRTVDLLRRVGKIPLVLGRYVPGFVVNRFQLAINSMAYLILMDGLIEPQDIDLAVESSIGIRLAAVGPFATMDLGGLDVVYESARTMGVEPPAPLAERVVRGELGVKSGRGFYDYSGRGVLEVERERDRRLLLLLEAWERGRFG